MISKGRLAIELSKLLAFKDPDPGTEQYTTDSRIASDVLWMAFMNGDVKGKIIADLGCGTGTLGIGALLLGAKKVIFVDSSKTALATLNENLDGNSCSEVICSDVEKINIKADTVIMNPPFGAKRENRNADTAFLDAAFRTAQSVYTFHMASSRRFVHSYAAKNHFLEKGYLEYDWPLRNSMAYHKKKRVMIRVGCSIFAQNL